jgi:acyl-[acyl-carrier-protein]-phospholipid O-acyltransferase/long-chain-fatty-acid--[acyl-carrier-protein] ligase
MPGVNENAVEVRRGIRGRSYWALMATMFLGALNDNALRMVVALLVVAGMGLEDAAKVPLLAAVLVVFALPFILFSPVAGYLADRFSKRAVIFWTKVAEAAVMGLAAVALWTGDPRLSLAVVFLMGAQSAFFGPAKFGVLPEILDDSELSRGNGLLEMFTEIAIILGGLAGTLLYDGFKGEGPGGRGSMVWIGVVLAGIAALGTLTSVFMEKLAPAGGRGRVPWNFLGEAWRNIRAVKRDRALFLSVLGVSYFWLMASLFQLNFYIYGYKVMDFGERVELGIGLYLALAGVGIGVGSVLAGKLSGDKVEFGLVPVGAACMAVFSLLLYFVGGSNLAVGITLLLLGAGSGFYLIPLAAFIQQRAPRDGKGTVIATNNFVSFTGIILGAVLYWLVGTQLDPRQVYLFLAVLTVGVTGYIFTLLPDFLLRFALLSFTRSLYRLRAVGVENVPREGGALLVCNHVSYLDALLVLSCLQRFVRFVMYRRFYDWPIVNWGCRQLRVIPISESDGPRAMVRSLRGAAKLVREGELVCIFAEGSITRTGNLLRFQRGFTRIMKGLDAPIIPVHIDRMWGSIFSFEGGRALWKTPHLKRSKVTVSFGRPLPATSTSAQVRQAVSELGAEAFALRRSDQVLLHEVFVASARSAGGRLCMADTTGRSLSYRRALAAALALGDDLKRYLPREGEMVGVLLPATVGAALANISLLLAGRVPVNLNWTAGREHIRSAVVQCGIRAIITSREFLEKVGLESLGLAVGVDAPRHLYLEDLGDRIGFGRRMWAALKAALVPQFLLAHLYGKPGRSQNDLCTVVFSSGSTGEPKGVMLTHANVMSDLEGLSQVFNAGPADRLAGVLPFFHSLGFTATLWLPLVKRIGVVYHPNPTEGRAVGALVRDFEATALLATPTFLRIYTRAVLPGDLGSLRDVVVGAEKLRDDVAGAFFAKFGVRPVEGYGCTECAPVVSINVPDFRAPGIMQKGTKPGTIGQPIPGVSVRVVDPERLEPLPPGEDGLLLVRGANVMKGYLNRPELTAEVMRGGWYVTGDIARIDEDGFITITDRLSRFSKVGGEMVPHGRVEEEIEKILDVEELLVAVAGVPDPKRGERLVVLHRKLPLSVEELHGKLAGSELPKLWVPRKDDFFEVEEIPVLGTGKVDLKGIKQLAAAKAGASRSPS